LYTGDFNYNIPLLTVTGPNGEQFPLNLNYHAGIRTNQEASWVGLGWDLSLGEISRSVNGMADDWKGELYEKRKVVEKTVWHGFPPTQREEVENQLDEASHYYGPLKFKNFDYAANSHMDLFVSSRGVPDGENSLLYPDYDRYYVSGPGIGGQIKPYLFDHANLYLKAEDGFTYGSPGTSNYKSFSKQAQFRFRAEGLTEIKTPYYGAGHSSRSQINNDAHHTSYPFEWRASSVHLWDNGLLTPAAIDAQNYDYEGDFDGTAPQRQRAHGGRYVEYFTNREIHEHYTSSDPNKHIDGFLEFEPVTVSTRNTPSDYDYDGIGAFRVTQANGMTYHYALPVYVDHEETRIFPFHKIGANYGIDRPGALDAIELLETDYRYAESWKLTAITGPDYEDVNGNSFPDDGDKVYWIYINYEKWNSDNNFFLDRTPFYGCHLDKAYKQVPSSQFRNLESYQLKGSVNRTYR
ncbi:MAG: hypothetical protein AAGB22_12355, partial [Bacteroidota bacterium]